MYRYSGDVDLCNGGTFFLVNAKDREDYGFRSAVRVTPCSDAGAQDNAWWVEELTVIKPRNDQELKSVLDVCGWRIGEDGNLWDYSCAPFAKKGTASFRNAIQEARVSYGLYDIDRSITVQIGKTSEFHSGDTVTPDETLRGNCSLARYVRREFMQ